MLKNPFAGTWVYRSYLNQPDMPEFGEGTFRIEDSPLGTFAGTLEMPVAKPTLDLKLRGASQLGNPFHARFQGTGLPGTGTAGWIYDYEAYLIPAWPNGVDQVTAMVGSVIRTVPHDGQPAGLVASFLAVAVTKGEKG
jgi:hypothetical protein